MKARALLFREMKKELRSVPVEEILRDCISSIKAYRKTNEFEHLIDLYFYTMSILLKETNFDEDMLNLIESDLEALFPQLN
jgi:hypothetical protein